MAESDEEIGKIIAVVTQIVGQLQETTTIREESLKAAYAQLDDNQNVPAVLKPRTKDAWHKILFKDNWKYARSHGMPLSFRQRIEAVLKAVEVIPPTLRRGERSWLVYFEEMLDHIRAAQSTPAPTGKTSDEVAAALSLLFGLKAEQHYSVSNAVVGEYFGYRFSSNRGRIVRFHIKIDPPTNGVLTFTNHYRQHPDKWDVRGCGLDVDGLTYLMGSAHAAGHEETGLGLRFFVVKKFRQFGWLTGLLNSLDRSQNPIASRIVLVPIRQHKSVNAEKSSSNENLLNLISSKALTPGDLDEEIAVPDPSQLNGLPVSTVIRSLIWNGTLRTLHGANAYVPEKEEGESYQHVFDFQEQGLAGHPSSTNDILFFAKLLSFDDVRAAVMNRLPLRGRTIEN